MIVRARDEFDIAIVGAGPAGNAAALTLADTGLEIVQIEAATLPRPKPCGGALPGQLPDQLAATESLEDAAWVERLIQDFDGGEPDFTGEIERSMPMVDRAMFDQHLSDLAVRRGNGHVVRLTGFRVRQVNSKDGRLELAGNNQRIRTRAVIAADGARSRLARASGLAQRPEVGIALDAELLVSPTCYARFANSAVFSHGRAPGGYAWIFPKAGNRLSCGIGGYGRPANLRRGLQQFLNAHIAASERDALIVRGHPLPPYRGHGPVARGGIYLAGDAASLVDPITGEGIWFALQSGHLAGRVLAWALTGNDSALASVPEASRDQPEALYQQLVHAHLATELDILARLAVPDLLEAPEFFYRNHLRGGFRHAANYQALAEAAQRNPRGGN